jgi:hypothetical protein
MIEFQCAGSGVVGTTAKRSQRRCKHVFAGNGAADLRILAVKVV